MDFRNLDSGCPMVICAAEGIKHDFLEFRRHTDSIILNREFIASKLRKSCLIPSAAQMTIGQPEFRELVWEWQSAEIL